MVLLRGYPHNTGAPELHVRLPDEQVRFPELLREAGYYRTLGEESYVWEQGPCV